MEDKKLQIGQARAGMNRIGAVLIVYYLIMNTAASLVLLADVLVYLLKALSAGETIGITQVLNHISDAALSNGWGYILAIVVGCVVLLIWKGKDFCCREIFLREKKMSVSVFIMLLCVFVLPQGLVMIYMPALEWLLNQLGLSATAALELIDISTDSLSMFLYASVLGPISEELLFRGVLLRLLRPYGKQAAILISAVLFGLFHGNLIQIPFAFLVGLVLGYVTVEYSIVWAMVLHIFNNFVLSDLIGRLAEVQPELAGILNFAVVGLFSIAAVILLIVEKTDVGKYFRENKMGRIPAKGFLRSPAVWIFTAMMLLSCLLTIKPI